MPYRPSWRASRSSRAAWASVRTGTGPSLAAMPPNSSRVMSAVLAPRSAARSAATTPAGPRDDERRQALQAPADRPPGNREAVALAVRPDDGILGIARANEDAVIYPLRLDELELPPEMRADKGEHQPPIGAVIL